MGNQAANKENKPKPTYRENPVYSTQNQFKTEDHDGP